MSEETYNGWKNYPTWAVNLWLSNERPLYEEALERTRYIIEEYAHPTTDVWTEEESKRFNTADMFKEWIDELARPGEEVEASMATDLLGWALDYVDYQEIADSWIEQVTEG
jgi:hypothetical protein